MSTLLRFVSIFYCSSWCFGEWVAIDTTSSATCSSDSTLSSVLTQVGVCLEVPSSFPSGLQIYESYIFDECEQDGDTMKLKVEWYFDDDCKGKSVILEAPVDSSCLNGSYTSCQLTPIAIEEDWPAIGLYSGDSSCEDPPSIISAYKPGCSDFTTFEDYSTSITCDATFDYVTYDGGTCSGDPVMNISSNLEVCERVSFVDNLAMTTSQSKLSRQQFTLHYVQLQMESLSSLMQVVVELSGHSHEKVLSTTDNALTAKDEDIDDPDVWYHYVSCSGVENIPGVKSNGKSSNDDDVYSGLGEAGLAVLLVLIIIGLAVASIVFARRWILKRKKDAEMKSKILGDDGDDGDL